MADHLFGDTTTYLHDYNNKDPQLYHRSLQSGRLDILPYKYLQRETLVKKQSELTRYHTQRPNPLSSKEPKEFPDELINSRISKPKYTLEPAIGIIGMHELPENERKHFIEYMYRPEYYSISKVGQIKEETPKATWTSTDKKMQASITATKTNLGVYGFSLPRNSFIAWGNAQPRTLPQAHMYHEYKKQSENPFPGYPDKLFPYLEQNVLVRQHNPTPSGYTGFVTQYADYPPDIKELFKKSHPYYIPHFVSMNAASGMSKVIPECHPAQPAAPENSSKTPNE